MKRQRQSFNPEFKYDSAILVFGYGYSMAEAGRAVDVLENTLRKWGTRLEAERGGSTPKSQNVNSRAPAYTRTGSSRKSAGTRKDHIRKATALLTSDDHRPVEGA